ncbi:MAG: T9SS type A sorting domain-containing protein [Balneolales bacterium]|nr:T9SS type A sorting domain-containing protein [Balneolales bacterium]
MKKNLFLPLLVILLFTVCEVFANGEQREQASSVAGNDLIMYAYFLENPVSEIRVAWIGKGDIEYYAVKRKVNTTEWIRFEASRIVSIPGSELKLNEINFRELSAGTSYEMQVRQMGTSEVLSTMKFRSLPASLDNTLTFVTGGDLYTNDEYFIRTSKAAAAFDPLFTAIGGDWAYADGNPAQVRRWFRLFQLWEEHMYTDNGFYIPMLPGIGNHEVVGGYGNDPSKAPLYFTFFDKKDKLAYFEMAAGDYLRFYVLDTGHTRDIAGEQTSWLRERLSGSADILHRFPLYHVPAFPSFRAETGNLTRQVRQHWVPLFEEFQISLSIENHDHAFKRTKPIRAMEEHPMGVVYIGDGAWGVNTRVPDSPNQRWYLEKSSADHHFWKIRIHKDYRLVEAYTQDLELLDSFVQYTRDTREELINRVEREDRSMLLASYPNPFNNSAIIPFFLPNDFQGQVRLEIYQNNGQRLAILLNEKRSPGLHQINFNASDYNLSTGTYFIRLQAGEEQFVRPFTHIK